MTTTIISCDEYYRLCTSANVFLSPADRLIEWGKSFEQFRSYLVDGLRARHPEALPRELMESLIMELYANEISPGLASKISIEIRTGEFRPYWRKILGISDSEPVD